MHVGISRQINICWRWQTLCGQFTCIPSCCSDSCLVRTFFLARSPPESLRNSRIPGGARRRIAELEKCRSFQELKCVQYSSSYPKLSATEVKVELRLSEKTGSVRMQLLIQNLGFMVLSLAGSRRGAREHKRHALESKYQLVMV